MGGFFAFKIPHLGFIKIFMSEYCLKFLLPLDRDKAAMRNLKSLSLPFQFHQLVPFDGLRRMEHHLLLPEKIFFHQTLLLPDVGKNLTPLSSFLSWNGSNVGRRSRGSKILSAKCVCGCTWIFVLFISASDLIRSWSYSWYVLNIEALLHSLELVNLVPLPPSPSCLSHCWVKYSYPQKLGNILFHWVISLAFAYDQALLSLEYLSPPLIKCSFLLLQAKQAPQRMTGEHISPVFLFCCKPFIENLHLHFSLPARSIHRVDRFCSLIALFLRLTVLLLSC